MTKLNREGKACKIKKKITEKDCEECSIFVRCIEDKAENILGNNLQNTVVQMVTKVNEDTEYLIGEQWSIALEFFYVVAQEFCDENNLKIDQKDIDVFVGYNLQELHDDIFDMPFRYKNEDEKKYYTSLIEQKVQAYKPQIKVLLHEYFGEKPKTPTIDYPN